MKKLFAFNIIIIACLILFISGTHFAAKNGNEPSPIAAYRRHRDAITKYISSIHMGKIPERKDAMRGYFVLDCMASEGVTAVNKGSDGSIYFIFGSMPPDSTPALVFCPGTRRDLRKIEPMGGRAIVQGQCFDDNWFYCESDDE